jgi:hypothetical protein
MRHPISARAARRSGVRVGALVLTAATATSVVAVGASAALPRANDPYKKQQLVVRSADGGIPNGIATEPDFSHDSRANRFLGYVSTATNIAGTVARGTRNVYVLSRTGSIQANGNAWQPGASRLVSAGLGGQPANGDSWAPSLSGFTKAGDAPGAAKQMAFLSNATNLVAGTPADGRTFAYVTPVGGGALRRIDAPGSATGVEVSGDSTAVVVSTTTGLYLFTPRNGKVRQLVKAAGITDPSVTARATEVVYARGSSIYTKRTSGNPRSKRVAQGSHPDVDAGGQTKKDKGRVRAVAYTSGGKAFRKRLDTGVVEDLGSQDVTTNVKLNGGGSTIVYGTGRDVGVRVRVLESLKFGGYDRAQGTCPEGQGDVTHVAVSTRYNYVAFTCEGGGLYLQHVGEK